ncbi:hypothetical protein ACFL0P_05360 [Candidatus Omnitrophota bacterium]
MVQKKASDLHLTVGIPPHLIRENRLHQIYSLIQMGKKYHMHTMKQSLAGLYNNGLIIWDDAYSRNIDPQELISLTRRHQSES